MRATMRGECCSFKWSTFIICGISRPRTTGCSVLKSLAISRISENLECIPRAPHTLSSSSSYPLNKPLKLLRFSRISGDWDPSLSKIFSTSISVPWTKLMSPRICALTLPAIFSPTISETAFLARLGFLVQIATSFFKSEVSSPKLSLWDRVSIYSGSFPL